MKKIKKSLLLFLSSRRHKYSLKSGEIKKKKLITICLKLAYYYLLVVSEVFLFSYLL